MRIMVQTFRKDLAQARSSRKEERIRRHRIAISDVPTIVRATPANERMLMWTVSKNRGATYASPAEAKNTTTLAVFAIPIARPGFGAVATDRKMRIFAKPHTTTPNAIREATMPMEGTSDPTINGVRPKNKAPSDPPRKYHTKRRSGET